jgi:hypothetical protein
MRTLSNRLTLPDDDTVIRGQLVFHSDFPLASQHRLIEELAARRRDLGDRLEIPLSDEPIHVYLFENAGRFDSFVRLYHPKFPARRAFFLETDTRLSVYAQWGDRVAEDLRHEVTHGYLHASIPHMPLWLDEGLAEYFEVPRGTRGLTRPHLDLLAQQVRRGDWQPSLERLESLDPAIEMTQQDYAEAWAWVYFMLETPLEARRILPAYLLELRQYGAAAPVSVRIGAVVPEPQRELLDCVRQMAPGASQPLVHGGGEHYNSR